MMHATLTPPRHPAHRVRQVRRLLDPAMLLHVAARTRCATSTRGSWSRNPVMFVVEVGAAARPRCWPSPTRSVFACSVVVWLWLTVLFANLAEAVAEGRGKAQAATLRRARTETIGRAGCAPTAPRRRSPPPQLRLGDRGRRRGRRGHPRRRRRHRRRRQRRRVGDHRRVRAGDPRVRRGPERRSPAAPRCCPTGSSCEITAKPGESFLDRMIALVEGAARQKTPNEIALNILLASLTIVFLLATVTLQPFAVVLRGRRSRSSSWSPCWSA